ncbi:MAG: HD domain-containing protein, partial [bacterium]
MLWDTGIDVGHSVRTIKETVQVHGKAIDSWASMLESRFLCGDESLAEKFYFGMRPFIEKKKDKWFIEGVFEEVSARHARFGNSVKLLEPNVKKSAGGLRDFQSLFWLYRGNDPDFFFPLSTKKIASQMCVEEMVRQGLLDEQESKAVVNALQFLFRARHEMHFRRKASSDALEYTLQQEVAEALGFGGTAELRSVEVFMREYYLHARTIYRLHQNLSHKFREMIEPVRFGSSSTESLGSVFFRTNDMLSVDPQVQRLVNASQVFEAFALSAEHEIELHVRLRRAIANSTDLFTAEQQRSPEVAMLFKKILCSRSVAKTLHDMNELNVLAAYLPEWAELVAFFQHNLYHYFTADEHTLIALAKAERLREEAGVMHEVFRNLPRKETLYLAILLHDIAKPRGVSDHEITGVDMARTILDRIGISDTFGDVSFLIRNHLIMEQIAFRRNIHDPATIKEFAAKFESPEQLDYLYLLTYADLSAVNINVWTEWKSSLLQELFQLTSEVLRRNLRGTQIDDFKRSRHEEAVEALVDRLGEAMPRERVHEHLYGIGSHAYIALFSDDEIEQHIHKSASEETISTIFTAQEGYTEVTVIAANASFAL